MSICLHRSLEFRLVALVSLGLLLFSLIAGMATYTFSYRNQLELAESLQQQLVRTVQTQAEVAVFAANKTIAQGVIDGLLANPLLSGVRLQAHDGFVLERGFDTPARSGSERGYPLFSPVDPAEKIGSIAVRQNDAQVDSEARKHAASNVGLMLLQIVTSAGLMFAVLRGVVTRPVARLTAALVAISPGSKARLAVDDKHSNDEIGLLTKSANALLDTAEKAIDEIQAQHDQMKRMATHDPLSGLPTMRLATDRLQVAISSARRASEQVALLFLDLDAFKAVNDTFGHDAGDALLQEVAQRLRKSIRDKDTAARIGGDEFLLILSGLQGRSAAATVAEKIVAAVSLPVAFAGHSLRVGASIGIALFPDHGDSMEVLRQAADSAMYRVKKAGKNGFGFAELGHPHPT